MLLCINTLTKTKIPKKLYISFYKQFDMFSYMIISSTCDLHMGQQNLTVVNTNNKLDSQKNNHFPCNPFKMNYVTF
jgi:hypothetical protein